MRLVKDWKEKLDAHVLEHVDLHTITLESGQVVQRVSVKAQSKLRALETIGKALGYFNEKVEHSDSSIFFISLLCNRAYRQIMMQMR